MNCSLTCELLEPAGIQLQSASQTSARSPVKRRRSICSACTVCPKEALAQVSSASSKQKSKYGPKKVSIAYKLEVFSEDIPCAALWYNCGTKWP